MAGLIMAPHAAIFYRELKLAEFISRIRKNRNDNIQQSRQASALGKLLSSGNKQVGEAETMINWLIMIASIVAISLHYPARKKKSNPEFQTCSR
ncbi:hypothetical protein ACFSQE_17655 [Vogesella fluminis]|uniref:hypothetical protein n=1 Tax=Vogesella fluminis TaxID=1069161 RepID=UPI003635AE82